MAKKRVVPSLSLDNDQLDDFINEASDSGSAKDKKSPNLAKKEKKLFQDEKLSVADEKKLGEVNIKTKIGKFLSLDSDVELNLKIEAAKTRVGQGDIANIAIKKHLMNLGYEFD
jgi:hypothetical protein